MNAGSTETAVKRLPSRHEVPDADRWDLSSLYLSDQAWEADFQRWEGQIGEYAAFQGRLGESPHVLAECLRFDSRFDRLAERLGTYAYLKTAEDTANSTYQAMRARYTNVASRAAQAASYIRPEIMAIDDARMRSFLADDELALYRVKLERMLRYKPYTLSEREEKLLAMQTEMAETAGQVFRQLNNADLKFGTIRNEKGELIELTHSTFSTCLHSPERELRRTAFHQYYEQFKAHENTLVATLNGSVQRDIYYAKARGYESALAASLFHDDVPLAVYDNLIQTVRKHLPAVHRYYDLRRRFLGLEDIHHYDTYVPLLAELETHRTWDEAVELVITALAPLGSEYCLALERGLRGRWCDRYENQGKQSGAFSSGSYDGDPYILMNYQSEVLDHVFTLAHEAGHSMHSRYSAKNQPFEYYDYAIFVAEVASTFNEELLSEHMLKRASSDKERAYLINREIDDIRATLVRQTMFAEFEKTTHGMAEAGEPLTLESLQKVYRELLETYFGPDFYLDGELSLECFRIPHFYRAFYVYKYATGLSAAIALSQRVLRGGSRERDDYLGLLKAGGSKYPLDILRDAGVDMSQPGPVDTALRRFEQLVEELEDLLSKP
jgi:oligoendopeptidase F